MAAFLLFDDYGIPFVWLLVSVVVLFEQSCRLKENLKGEEFVYLRVLDDFLQTPKLGLCHVRQ